MPKFQQHQKILISALLGKIISKLKLLSARKTKKHTKKKIKEKVQSITIPKSIIFSKIPFNIKSPAKKITPQKMIQSHPPDKMNKQQLKQLKDSKLNLIPRKVLSNNLSPQE